ncbi:MAG: Pyridine nucleotide-disulfide oxidoreductase, FAD/NAD(P)-binding domain protein [Phycisphaerales bacterium]|nr:Pyridine nucleotide-disulfide oxidoreductase, FAD/NAD(P)-binding domain protein [Phycisphaerales bacterium]
MPAPGLPTRIVILGAGFGGVYTALHLQRLFRKDPSVYITLVDRDNYFLMTPLLFEAGSGVLEPRHAVTPIRTLLKKAQFVEADVERIDLDARIVHARHSPAAKVYALAYDYIVLALGGVTNTKLIPGAENAFTFKTLSDAIFLRNHIIDLFEQAEVETDPARKRRLLTFVAIGGGLVGIELIGELTEFTQNLTRTYHHINASELEFHLVEAGPKLMPEMERDLAEYAGEVLKKRGVRILMNTRAQRIEPGRVYLPAAPADVVGAPAASFIESHTIMLVAGVTPSPLLADLPLEKDNKGRLIVESSMRCQARPEVWALGDCAHIPDPAGNPYPSLAQHALREARVLARNIQTALRTPGAPLEPFVYKTLGMLASLGHYKGVGRVFKLKIRGFVAWWVWRTYYLMQMPRWNRRFRIMLDWTVALLFRGDVAKLDLFGTHHPTMNRKSPPPPGPPNE